MQNAQGITTKSLSELSVLDIGCGWGETLSYFKDRGASVYGFDPSPDAVAHAKRQGVNAKVSSMEDMNVFGRTFDVILMQNVLEHLAHPDHIIERVGNELLQPGGILAIDVPNEFNAFQTAGRDVHSLDDWWVCPPTHLNYFSHDSLSRLLEGNGFDIVQLTSSFPMEMFLLFGDRYVGDAELGRRCHERRMAFELNLVETGNELLLSKFNEAMASLGLGRQILAYARKR